MKRLAAIALAASICAAAQAADGPFAIAIHGGAGAMTRASLAPERESVLRAALTEALETGRRILAEGGSSLDAVTAAVRVLEDSPHTSTRARGRSSRARARTSWTPRSWTGPRFARGPWRASPR